MSSRGPIEVLEDGRATIFVQEDWEELRWGLERYLLPRHQEGTPYSIPGHYSICPHCPNLLQIKCFYCEEYR